MTDKEREKQSRVTTVELSVDDLRYINKLIAEGKVRSLKEFVELCVKFGKNYTLDRWETGVFNVDVVRVLLLPKRMSDILVHRIETEEYADVGREMGEVVESFALLRGLEVTDKSVGKEILKIFSDFGFGSFSLTDDKVQVEHPAFPPEITKGILEEVFKVKLVPIKMMLDVQFFKIIKTA